MQGGKTGWKDGTCDFPGLGLLGFCWKSQGFLKANAPPLPADLLPWLPSRSAGCPPWELGFPKKDKHPRGQMTPLRREVVAREWGVNAPPHSSLLDFHSSHAGAFKSRFLSVREKLLYFCLSFLLRMGLHISEINHKRQSGDSYSRMRRLGRSACLHASRDTQRRRQNKTKQNVTGTEP